MTTLKRLFSMGYGYITLEAIQNQVHMAKNAPAVLYVELHEDSFQVMDVMDAAGDPVTFQVTNTASLALRGSDIHITNLG